MTNGLFVLDVRLSGLLGLITVEFVSVAYEEWTIIGE